MLWWRLLSPLVLCSLAVAQDTAAGAASDEAAAFRSSTRLVEVEVVVRDQPLRPPGVAAWFDWAFNSGPPFGPPGEMHKGLTKDDFVLLDQGKPQPIAVFHDGATPRLENRTVLLPPGAVSNRGPQNGNSIHGATVVFIDFLNSRFGCRGYERQGLAEFLRSFSKSEDRVAVYTLGKRLHVLHDFTDDPQTLIDAATLFEQPYSKLPPPFADAFEDVGDVMTGVAGGEAQAASVHWPWTIKALQPVIQHLAGVQGRRNFIWVMDWPRAVPPSAIAMMQRAGIRLYPLQTRLVSGGLGPDTACGGGGIFPVERLAEAAGTRPFFDIRDLMYAVRATEEDTSSSYVLGFYPPDSALDGRFHKLTVKLTDKALEKQQPELQYRTGYFATKAELPPPPPTLAELFEEPLESTVIGLTGQAAAEPGHPGTWQAAILVDLHDIHLEHKDGRYTGSFDVSVVNEAVKNTANTATARVNIADNEFAAELEKGHRVDLGGIHSSSGVIRVVVRDRVTHAAGSLRIPVPTPGQQAAR